MTSLHELSAVAQLASDTLHENPDRWIQNYMFESGGFTLNQSEMAMCVDEAECACAIGLLYIAADVLGHNLSDVNWMLDVAYYQHREALHIFNDKSHVSAGMVAARLQDMADYLGTSDDSKTPQRGA